MTYWWRACGYTLLTRGPDQRLVVTDDYLRAYYARPELAPIPESCEAERDLHQSLVTDPRRPVADQQIAAAPDRQVNLAEAALADFRQYLALEPRADDADTVLRQVAELQQFASRLN